MKAASDSSEFALEKHPQVDVMILYADTLSRSRVMTLYQRLHHELWDEFEFNATWWKFDYFAHPQIAVAAGEAAMKADIMFFAIKSGTVFPEILKAWLAQQPPVKSSRGKRLLTMIEYADRAVPQASSSRNFLRGVAERLSMDYLPYIAADLNARKGMVNDEPPKLMEPGVPQNSPRTNPVQHWGLNE